MLEFLDGVTQAISFNLAWWTAGGNALNMPALLEYQKNQRVLLKNRNK